MAEELEWTGKRPPSFNPYGIAVFKDTVMVVNLRREVAATDSVEVLTFKRGQLKRRRRPVSSIHFTRSGEAECQRQLLSSSFSLTSIVPLSENTFYVSNTFTYRKQWLQWTELLGHFRSGAVLHFDGARVEPVISRLKQPMGMLKEGK